jgi:hypothetical protein
MPYDSPGILEGLPKLPVILIAAALLLIGPTSASVDMVLTPKLMITL